MSTCAPLPDVRPLAGEHDSHRPYREYSAVRLCEMLERQYDLEQPFDERIVFELANRALAAEGALARDPG